MAHSPLLVPNKGPGGRNKQLKGGDTVKPDRLETFSVVTYLLQDISNFCLQLVFAAPITTRGFQLFAVLAQVFV